MTQLFHLATKLRHRYGSDSYVTKYESDDGRSRNLRTCEACGTIKVTVHDPNGGAHREWWTDGMMHLREPVCVPVEVGAART